MDPGDLWGLGVDHLLRAEGRNRRRGVLRNSYMYIHTVLGAGTII